MTTMERTELAKEVSKDYYKQQVHILEELYHLPTEEMRRKEKQELISLSLNMVIDAQELLVQVLKAHGVKNSYTLWQQIVYQLPQISYAYIDWDSIKKPIEAHRVLPQTNSPASEKSVADNVPHSAQDNQLLELAIPGGVAVGTIILLTISPIGSALGLFKSLCLIVGTTAGGYMVQRLISSAQKPAQKHAPIQTPAKQTAAPVSFVQEAGNEAEVFQEACKLNLDRLAQWCNEFERIILNTLEDENV